MNRPTQLPRRIARSLPIALAAALAATAPGAASEGAGPSAGPRPGWSAGLAVIAAPRPYVGADSKLLVVPFVEGRGRGWFVRGPEAGLTLWSAPPVQVQARARVRFAGLDPADSPALEGMSERRWTVEGGLAAGLDLGRTRAGRWRLEATVLADLLGRSGGTEAALALGWRRRLGSGSGAWLAVTGGVVHRDADLVAYYYGVRPEEARPGRPAYTGKAATGAAASASLALPLGERWTALGLVSAERLGGGITASPIVDRKAQAFALLALARSF